MKIVVASTNPVKLSATKEGFTICFPDEQMTFDSISVSSEVSSQPMTEEETQAGARNRVKNARKNMPDAEYWVGIEGGVEERNGEMETFAWVHIERSDGKVGKGKTGTFFLPDKIKQLISDGKELGIADDIVFEQTNSKQKQGAVGALTKDRISRIEYYKPAVIFALIPFLNPTLY